MPSLPPDSPSRPRLASLADPVKPEAPPITDEQRTDAFRAEFFWRGRPLQAWSLDRETYWREYRAHVNAPPIGSYQTTGDFLPEALRVLWIASLTEEQIALLRTLPVELQTQSCGHWARENCTLRESMTAAETGQAIIEAVMLARTVPVEAAEYDGLGELPRPLTTLPTSSGSRAPQAGESVSSAASSRSRAGSTTSTRSARRKASRKGGR